MAESTGTGAPEQTAEPTEAVEPGEPGASTVRPPSRWRAAFASELGVLGFLLVNAVGLLTYYARHENLVAEVALVAPDTPAWVHFHAYLLTGLGLMLVLAWALCVGEAWLWPTRQHRTWTGRFMVLAMTVLVVLVVMDTRLVEVTGIHLYSDLVLETLDNPNANRELQLDGAASRSLLVLSLSVVVAEIVLFALASSVNRRLARQQRLRAAPWASGVLAGIVVVSLTVTLVTRASAQQSVSYLHALPFYAELLAEPRFAAAAGRVEYPTFIDGEGNVEAVAAPDMARTPNILFVMAESLRADAMTPEGMPRLHALARQRGCVLGAQHHAGGHTTEYGVFAALYAIDGYNYEPFERDDVPSYPLALLARAGYALHGASASQLKAWNGGGFMFEAFDSYAEYVDIPADEGDPRVVSHLLEVARKHGDGPLFGFAFFNATHHNYLYPAEFELHTPVVPGDYDHFLGDDRLAEHREGIINRYLNSVAFVDHLAAELISGFPANDDGLVVVFTGDHGEEFWEWGLLGHGAARYVAERTQVPLMVCLPESDADTITTDSLALSGHTDLWPTVFDAIGATIPLADERWTTGRALGSAPRQPGVDAVYIGGLDFPWDYDTMAFVDGQRKFWMRLCTGDVFCIEPFRVTEMDDAPVAITSGRENLQRHTQGLYDRVERFVRMQPAR